MITPKFALGKSEDYTEVCLKHLKITLNLQPDKLEDSFEVGRNFLKITPKLASNIQRLQ